MQVSLKPTSPLSGGKKKSSHDGAAGRLNPLAAGLNLNPGLKADGANKEIEEAMKRVREAQSLISAAIEPGSECTVLVLDDSIDLVKA